MSTEALEWMDIETAPKDGTEILIYDEGVKPAVEDALWEVRRMAYELLTPNALAKGREHSERPA